MAHDPVASDLPTLHDDEERFAALADAFALAMVAAIPTWVVRIVGVVAAGADRALDSDDRARIADVGARLAAELAEPLRSVLVADVDSGGGSPLAVLRDGVGPITALLTDMGLPAPRRDEFAVRHFPADLYELGPTSFAEIDQDLHEPGLVWGASRAHIHLRRRGAQVGSAVSVVAVVTRDLMDGGRFRAIAPGVVVVRDPDPSALTDALCIVVDLAGGFDLGALVAIGPPVIAYGAHVDTDALDAAKRAGCHDAIPRSRIVRRVGELAAGDPLV